MFDDKVILNTNEIYNFLKDYENNCEIHILEESKQKKSELIEVAKAKGILVEGSFDLAIIKLVYVFPDEANGNRTRIPKEELLKKLPTLIGKPLNLDHIRRYTIGYFIDYRYIEKENKVIAYAIVFKEIFSKEWEQLLTLFKQKKLTTSYEIWSDKRLTEYNSDGTKTLHNLQVGGGAIIWKEKPAFKDARVLEVAKKYLDSPSDMELVYACINKKDLCTGKCDTCKKCSKENRELFISSEVPQKPVPIKIVCSNCGRNFEYSFVVGQTNSQIKCTNCFAVLDSSGKMIYPPQLRNFNLSCPGCRNTNNWLILSKDEKEDKAKIKCQSCSKEYNIKFKDEGIKSQIIKQLMFLRDGVAPCIQCGYRNEFSVPSDTKIISIKCKKCELPYTFDVEHKRVRTIENVEELKLDNENKSLKEDKGMDKKYVLEEARKVLRKAGKKIRVFKKEVALAKANLEAKNSKVTKFVGGIKKLANKTRELRTKVKGYELEKASLEKKVEETKQFYLENAKKIITRRNELNDNGEKPKFTDEQILDDKDYELAVAKMKLSEKEAEEKKDGKKLEIAGLNVGNKTHDNDFYKGFREGVNKVAFPKS